MSDNLSGRRCRPMAYNNKAELKTLYVKQILKEETDAGHGLSMK